MLHVSARRFVCSVTFLCVKSLIHIAAIAFVVVLYILYYVFLKFFVSVINQLDAQNFCFTVSLSHASTCFEHMVLETCRGMK